MRLGKEEAVGYVEDTFEDTLEDTPAENSEASPFTVAQTKADQQQQPLTAPAEPLRAG